MKACHGCLNTEKESTFAQGKGAFSCFDGMLTYLRRGLFGLLISAGAFRCAPRPRFVCGVVPQVGTAILCAA